jgi:hypothetical protein
MTLPKGFRQTDEELVDFADLWADEMGEGFAFFYWHRFEFPYEGCKGGPEMICRQAWKDGSR